MGQDVAKGGVRGTAVDGRVERERPTDDGVRAKEAEEASEVGDGSSRRIDGTRGRLEVAQVTDVPRGRGGAAVLRAAQRSHEMGAR